MKHEARTHRGRKTLSSQQRAARHTDRCTICNPKNGRTDIGKCHIYPRPYPHILVEGKLVSVVRWLKVALEGLSKSHLFSGERGVYLLHDCDDNRCINPTHTHWGNVTDNTHEKIIRHRQWCALDRPQAILLWSLFFLWGWSAYDIWKDKRFLYKACGDNDPRKMRQLNIATVGAYIRGDQLAFKVRRADCFAKWGIIDPYV